MILCLLGCLLLLSGTEAAGAGIKAAIKQSTFEMIKNVYLPIIMRTIGVLHIPDIEDSNFIYWYKVSSIQLTPTELHSNDVHIVLHSNTNRISITVGNIGANGSFHLDWRFLFIIGHCNGPIYARGIGALLTIVAEVDGEGRPVATVASAIPYIGLNNLGIWANCDIFEPIVNLVIFVMRDKIIGSVISTIEGQVPPMINTIIRDIIGKYNLWVDIGPNMGLSWKVTKTPWVNADYLCASLAGHIFLKSKPEVPINDPPYVPDFNPNHANGAQLFLTDYTLRSGLYAAFAAGLLTAEFTTPVGKYDVTLNCAAVRAPVLTLDTDLEVTVNGRCALTAKDRTNGEVLKFALIGDILLMVKERVKKQTLYFKIEDIALDNLEVDNPFKYDIKWLEDQINNLLEQLANDINVTLGRNGVPLPTLQGIDYSDIEEQGRRGYFEVFATPILKPSIIRSSF